MQVICLPLLEKVKKKTKPSKLNLSDLIKILPEQESIKDCLEVINEILDKLTEKGYTRADCATDIKVNESTLSRWRNDESTPSMKNYLKLSAHLTKKVKEYS